MFHTPPVKTDWKSETALACSYDLSHTNSHSNSSETSQPITLDNDTKSSAIEFDNNGTEHNLNALLDKEIEVTKNHDTTLHSDNSSFIESFEIPSESDFPIQLLKVYEGFLKELKEPKFERSLASFEISELFHSFYQRFNIAAKEYIEHEGKFELSDYDSTTSYQHYKFNLILERLMCDKFYNQIIFPLKSIEIDEFEKEFNDEFSDKLGCLSSLDLHFKNLDIQLSEILEFEFINQLDEKILPEFELLTAERSPTLKMKYLIRIHKKIGQILNEITKNSHILNTDMYLPILIFSIIKIKELRSYFLIRQLNLIKRFSNEYIFDNPTESLQIEKGKLLYVCANFEAAISYLASVTIENLDIPIPSEDINLLPGSLKTRNQLIDLLTIPLKLESIDENVLKFKQEHPLNKSSMIMPNSNYNPLNNFTSNWIDYSKVSLPNPVFSADQGIKSISLTIDSSIKNIMGKVPWISAPNAEEDQYYDDTLNGEVADTQEHANSNPQSQSDDTFTSNLLKQLQENDAFEEHIEKSNVDNNVSPSTTNDFIHRKSLNEVQEGLISKLTTSVGGVMKNFRPLSETSSSTSLHNEVQGLSVANPTVDTTNVHITATSTTSNVNKNPNTNTDSNMERNASTGNIISPNKSRSSININMRSRATSFMNTSLFGSPNTTNENNNPILPSSPTKEYRTSILSSLENALDNVRNRSRDNSLMSQNSVNAANLYPVRSNPSNLNLLQTTTINEEVARMKPITKAFEEMSVVELHEMYTNYQLLTSLVSKKSL